MMLAMSFSYIRSFISWSTPLNETLLASRNVRVASLEMKPIEVSENFGHSVRIAGRGSCDGIVVEQGPWLLAMARHGNHSFILDLSVSKNAVLRR